MPDNTSGGTTTSFSNTPQAQTDVYNYNWLTEDWAGIYCFDVMSNDLGGAAKTLWAIDNGTNSTSSTLAGADLLVQDTARIESTSNDTSANGAKIWITTDGKVGYDAATLSATFKASLQALAVNETTTDTFTYAIRLGNGTLSWNTVTLVYKGTNDGPDISVATGDHAAKSIAETNGSLTTSGTLTVVDPDTSDNVTMSVTGFLKSGDHGTLTDNQLKAMFTLNSPLLEANPGSANNLGWSFNSAGTTFDYLTATQSLVLTYSITADDGHGGVDTQQVTVTINGSNDAASITVDGGVTDDRAVIEAGGFNNATAGDPSASGKLLVSDADTGEDHFLTPASLEGSYGTFTFDAASGAWTYTLDNARAATQALMANQPATDTLVVRSADGTSYNLVVNITGTNDAAVITGSSTAELTESNAAQSTGGDLNATDVDSSAAFVVQTDVAGSNGYGSFSIAADGTWTYTMSSAHDEFVGGQDYSDSITVATADGTTQVLTVTMHGTNDAAVITGSSTAELTESNAAQSTGGDLNATDVDSSAAFVVQTDVAGSNGYGSFSIAADGTWTYTMSSAHDEFVGGQDYSDSITVATADGTTQVLTVTMHGTNDAAVITGSSTAELTESNAAQSTGGDLNATDVDSSAAFVVQTDVAGSNGYGSFSIAADGTWTYTMSSAHDEFVGGQDYSDSITVATADGTTQVLTVTMHGTNDAAVITGSSTAELTESNAAQSTGGDLNATDVDSSAAFVVQTDVAGSNGYGSFSIAADGTWTYTMSSAHDEFVGGQDYSDSITVATADGTTQVLTVTMHGTNDAAVITGSSTAELTESNAAQSTGGDLNATDVDSSAAFVVQTDVAGSNGYGSFSIAADGTWTYTMSSAHDEFVGGQDYSDSITVATADGTTQVLTVTMHGTNDAAVITGSSTAELTESNAAQSTGGDLNATDVDSSAAFVVQTDVAGSNGYGSFSIAADGTWTYTMSSAHDEFVGGQDYSDSITVATADGTTQVLTVTMHGTNDAAVLSSAAVNLTEGNTAAAISTGGTLTITDVDSPQTFVAQAGTVGNYGTFAIGTNGAWTYTASSAHDEFVAGTTYTDTFSVASADGTTTSVAVNILGTNDAGVDLVFTYTGSPGNSLPSNTVIGQITTVDPDGGAGAYSYSITNLTATNLAGVTQSANGAITINSSGAISASNNLVDDRIYEVSIQVTQGAATFVETFSVITGTNATDTVGSSGPTSTAVVGDDVIFARGQGDFIFAGSGNDTVFGQAADDNIYGQAGNDTLEGNAGDDHFYFDTALSSLTNVDIIRDMNGQGNDFIHLDDAVFAGLTAGSPLALGTSLVINATGAASGTAAQVIYNSSNGALYYDADGTGGASTAIQFATLTGAPSLTTSDFIIY